MILTTPNGARYDLLHNIVLVDEGYRTDRFTSI